MSDAEAAIQAANITLWGAIIVGALAMIGTIVSSVIAPSLRARAEAKLLRENARIDALRALIPEMVILGMRNRFRDLNSPVELGELAAAIVRFEMWLAPDEAVLGRIARNGLVMEHSSSPPEVNASATTAFAAASGLLPVWARGEISAAEVVVRYRKQTGRHIA